VDFTINWTLPLGRTSVLQF